MEPAIMVNDMGNHPQEERLNGVMNRVFGSELLRDMILDYVIHDKTNKNAFLNISSCRLVCKDWCQSVSRILLKSQEPLFRINLNAQNSTAGTPFVQENGKLLDQFLVSASRSLSLNNKIPPHSITVSDDFFVEDNHQQLMDCLSKCGSGLFELSIPFFKILEIMQLNTKSSLSKLQSFNIFVAVRGPGNDFERNRFIQSVFDAAQQLKSFKYEFCLNRPQYLYFWTLPSSIANVTMVNCTLNNGNLGIFVKGPLPHLKTLKLEGNQESLDAGLISRILQNVRTTLKSLHLGAWPAWNLQDSPPPTFQLPLMEKLEYLGILGMYVELENESSPFEELLPAVNHVVWTEQRPATFCKWMEKSRFDKVTTLKISCDNSPRNQDLAQAIPVNQMEAIHRVYPNICKLDVKISERSDLPNVQVIWKEMKSLTHLTICAPRSEPTQSSNVWDGLLLGIPTERVETLKESLDLLDESPVLLDDSKFRNAACIRDLTDLQTLELVSREHSDFSLISDVAFQYAFMKMPKLFNLILRGGFFARKMMADTWTRLGRSIETREW